MGCAGCDSGVLTTFNGRYDLPGVVAAWNCGQPLHIKDGQKHREQRSGGNRSGRNDRNPALRAGIHDKIFAGDGAHHLRHLTDVGILQVEGDL